MSDEIEMIPVSWVKNGKRWTERRDVERVTRAVYSPEGKRISPGKKHGKESGKTARSSWVSD